MKISKLISATGFSTNKKTLEDIDALKNPDKPATLRPGDRGDDEDNLPEPEKEAEKPKEGVTASQLALKLGGLKKPKPESLKVGEGELEIKTGEEEDASNNGEEHPPTSLSITEEK